MSYEEEKQDRKIEQLEIKIEWLQNANTNFACQACDQAQEIERLRAELAKVNQAREAEIDQAGAAERIYLEGVWLKDARIKELEDALVEYQRLGKTVSEAVVPCLTAHGNCDQCRPKAKAACDAIETIRKGKIGPDAALKKQWDDVLGTKPRSWQITDERKAAIQHILMCHHCRVDDSGCKASVVLRAMLEAGQ